MPFRKNDERINRNGRPLGARNKSIEELRGILQSFIERNLDDIQKTYDQLEPVQKLNFLDKVISKVLPAPITLEQLNDSALDALLDRLKNDTGQPASITIYPDDVDL
jgi:hypothetical protein